MGEVPREKRVVASERLYGRPSCMAVREHYCQWATEVAVKKWNSHVTLVPEYPSLNVSPDDELHKPEDVPSTEHRTHGELGLGPREIVGGVRADRPCSDGCEGHNYNSLWQVSSLRPSFCAHNDSTSDTHLYERVPEESD